MIQSTLKMALLFFLSSFLCQIDRCIAQADNRAAVEIVKIAEIPAVQDDEKNQELKEEGQKQESDSESANDESSVINTADYVDQAGEEIGERTVRFHLWNGLIIGGDLEVQAINVETEFGALTIPIDKIQRIYPGLDSFPELSAEIDSLVEGLGDKNFEVRENSHNQLVRMGSMLRNQITQFDDGGSVERKKHLAEIKKKIEEFADDESESESQSALLIRGDRIVTAEFTIVGKIVQNEFALNSKYGNLRVQLADIQMADRTFNQVASEIRRNLTIDAMDFFPEGTSTKIRVKKGDKIKISASGTVNWVNWNTSCGPDGMTDKGQFKGHPSGKLLARIGEQGDYLAIGSEGSFVAKSSGMLFLGIGVAENYTRNTGYRWTGEYKARILVQPTLDSNNPG